MHRIKLSVWPVVFQAALALASLVLAIGGDADWG